MLPEECALEAHLLFIKFDIERRLGLVTCHMCTCMLTACSKQSHAMQVVFNSCGISAYTSDSRKLWATFHRRCEHVT